MSSFLDSLKAERDRQVSKYGQQRHPDGTGEMIDVYVRDDAIHEALDAAVGGKLTWRLILKEEVMEAFAEREPEKIRHELVQATAVIQAWIEDLDSREGT